MNKIRKIVFLAGMAAILMYIAPACNKEKHEEQLAIHPEGEFMNDEDLVNKVLDFSQMATNLKEGKMHKSGEKMLIDDAIYYISATLNYVYCNHTAAYGKMQLDTVNISLPIIATEGKAFLVDALEGYNVAVGKAREKFVKINMTDRKLINIAYLGSNINSTGDAMNISLEIYTGTGSAPVINSYGTFEDEEQFWWLRDSENCFNGDDILGGAPNVLEQHILFKFMPAPPTNCRSWFPFTEPKDFIATNYPDGIPDYFCDYKIFYAHGPVINVLTDRVQCLGLDVDHPGIHEMDYYLNGLDQILTGFLANTGKSVATFMIDSPPPMIDNDAPSYITIWHEPHLTYGKKMTMCWAVPNNDLPITIE